MKRRHVVTIHDLAPIDFPEGLSRAFRLWYSLLIPKLVKNCAAVLTVSQFIRQSLIERFKASSSRVFSIPNGVDSAVFYPATASDIKQLRSRLGVREKYVLAVGSLVRRKNLAMLVEAWTRIYREIPDVKLLIVGDIGASHIFTGEQGISYNVPGIQRLGRVTDDDLRILYSGAAVYVNTSLYEGFGLPIVEAMACGAPVIATNCGSFPEVMGDAGILYDPMSPTDLAGEILKLLGDHGRRRQMTKRGLIRAQTYSWDLAARRVYEVLQNV